MKEEERIKELEEELKKTPYNKATQHHIGLVKAKIARLRDSAERKAGKSHSSSGFDIRRSGDATVVLLGFPSVGKSTILNGLTNARSKIGSYEFTTLNVVPGVMHYGGANIQILDIPGIVKGAHQGVGRGRAILSIVRNSDLALIIIDALAPGQLKAIKNELYAAGIRLNREKPDVSIRKRAKGGVSVGSTVKLTRINKRIIMDILKEFRIFNAEVIIRDEINEDDFVDVLLGNRTYIKAAFIINKKDLVSEEEVKKMRERLHTHLEISAEQKGDIARLKRLIFLKSGIKRVFLKEPGKRPDLKEPIILKKDDCLRELCTKLHQDFVRNFRFARIWGRSARFPGQMIKKLSHELRDRDIVEIHLS